MNEFWGVIFLSLVVSARVSNCGRCPFLCECFLDDKGRRVIKCGRGGLENSIPIGNMTSEIEVLDVSAPPSLPNNLTIGPIFQKLERVEEIHIVQSNIPAIGSLTFYGLKFLKILNLAHNAITTVIKANFQGLSKLKKLHLDYNKIDSMHSGAFMYLSELKELTLSHNRITTLAPRVFLRLADVQTLDLSYNGISILDADTFRDIRDLRDLKCRKCTLNYINGHVYRILNRLTHLDLGENVMKFIAYDDFTELTKLQTLLLDGNMFPVITDNSFSSQKNLKILNFSRNRLAKIPLAAFNNLTSLQMLDISYNLLGKFDARAFDHIGKTLVTLYISGNVIDISDISTILETVPNLQSLSIADMSLTTIPYDSLSGARRLKFLNISGNGLKTIPIPAMASLFQLTHLDLSRNHIKGANERAAAKLASLSRVHLHGNPWSCDLCHAPALVHRANISADIAAITCATPPRFRGTTLANLTRETCHLEWCQEENSFSNIMAVSAKYGLWGIFLLFLVMALLFGIAAVNYALKKRHCAHYYTHEGDKSVEKAAIFKDSRFIRAFDGRYKRRKIAAIATIDELTKDPEWEVFANGNGSGGVYL